MYQKTRGIVLHTIKYSETSVITKIYTERFGLVSYIVKGVRSTKSKSKASMMQPLTLLEMEVSQRENKQLQFIKEFRRAYNYHSLPFDVIKSTVSLFLLEVIAKCIREHEKNEEMFEFIYDSFCELDKAEKMNPDFHLLFLVHFTTYLGFTLHGDFSEQSPYFDMNEGVFTGRESGLYILGKEESAVLYRLSITNPFSNTPLKLSRAARKQMLGNILKYYQLHVENFSLKSPEILEEILD